MLWEWRNEPGTRSASYNSKAIPYEDHLRWVQERLGDPQTRLLVALNADGDEVGYARLEINETVAEVSLSVDPQQRNRGFGTALIGSATRFAVKQLGVRSVIAHVKRDNAVSLSAFARAGFVRVTTLKILGQDSVRMIYRDDASLASGRD